MPYQTMRKSTVAFMLGNHLNFIDSFQFMSSSLDKLVSNLPKELFKYTSEEFTSDKLSLMSQKGVHPYDYMGSFEKFDQTELPTKELFYSVLNDQHITNEEYNLASKVWKSFSIKTIGEYHDLSLNPSYTKGGGGQVDPLSFFLNPISTGPFCSTGGRGVFHPLFHNSFVFKVRLLKICTELLWDKMNILR